MELLGKTLRIVYGKYQKVEYKAALNLSDFAIFISRSETQGIALLEAWAMNIPTFIWDPHFMIYKERVYSQVSAAPYLSDQTGVEWFEPDQLKFIVNIWEKGGFKFSPRKQVIACFADKICAQSLLNLLGIDC